MRLLLIEDDKRIAENLVKILKKESYALDCAYDGTSGLDKVRGEDYDLIILDWMLPDMDGVKVCAELRNEQITIPILMLTAKSQLEDIVEGLNSGADDYITKPFKIDELFARIRALMRRNTSVLPLPVLEVMDLRIDTNSHKVWRDKKEIILSPKEYAILEYMVKNKNKALDRMDIFSHVWDENADLFTNAVDVYIRYLRRKIDGGSGKKIIKTIRGKGYMIEDMKISYKQEK